MSKKDFDLGFKVRDILIREGIETPMNERFQFDEKYQLEIIHHHFGIIMEALGLDLSDDSLQDTPSRISKMFVNELFYGLNYENFPKCTVVENKLSEYARPVIIENIPVVSVCEHHFQSIIGVCTIRYTPKNYILGLSKFNRIVDFFSRRPQIQERLTVQIGVALEYILETKVNVHISATHNCVRCRGVQQEGSTTKTFFN